MEWEEFFVINGDRDVTATYYELTYTFTVEDLYQAFKQRLLAEFINSGTKEV